MLDHVVEVDRRVQKVHEDLLDEMNDLSNSVLVVLPLDSQRQRHVAAAVDTGHLGAPGIDAAVLEKRS